MAFKILFATDLHLRAMRPISRTDNNYLNTLMGKLDQIRVLSEGTDMVVIGGDIFERANAAHSVVIRTIRAMAKFKVPVYTIIGQHDVMGYQEDSIDATAMGILLESGVVKRLDTLHGVCEEPMVSLYGLHAFGKAEWTVPEGEGTKILVAHRMLTNKPIPNTKCININDVAEVTNAHVILSGDIHYPHNVEANGVKFVNPGAMARMSIADRDRHPQVAMITIEDNGEVEVEFQVLDVRPAEAAFDLKYYSERMASEEHSKEFSRMYAKAVIEVKGDPTTIRDRLSDFLDANKVDEEMRKMVDGYRVRAEGERVGEIHD